MVMGFFGNHDEHCERDAPDSPCRCSRRRNRARNTESDQAKTTAPPPSPARPNLGLATTMELINELQARASVSQTIGEDWPNYKTVSGR